MPEYEFPTTGPIGLAVRLPSGRLSVTAEERTTASVTVLPERDSQAGRDTADRVTVDMVGDQLTVSGPELSLWPLRRNTSLRLEIRVPTGSRLEVKVASMDVEATGAFGDTAVKSASGDIRIDRIDGSLGVNTASGDARVRHVGGDLSADTASGDLVIDHVAGDARTHSASGDVTLREVRGSLTAKTASGDLRVDAVERGTVRITSASGDVRVGVQRGASVWLDVSSTSGRTRTDLDVGDQPPATGTPDLNLYIRSVSGGIDVFRAKAPVAS
jgi:DUF4097 and DUF4098 domain-containing protein YvlB